MNLTREYIIFKYINASIIKYKSFVNFISLLNCTFVPLFNYYIGLFIYKIKLSYYM